MADTKECNKYDNVLSTILVNEKSILGFLSAIFSFLARRTDFYYVPEGPYENMGFPPGVAEQLVLKVLRSCDPKNWKAKNAPDSEINNEIMCSTVAQEVEIGNDEETTVAIGDNTSATSGLSSKLEALEISSKTGHREMASPDEDFSKPSIPENYTPPVIPTQKDSESYNGAVRDKYTWSQTIMELDVTVKLWPDIKSAKDLKVTINSGDITIQKKNGEVILKDSFPYKIKGIESFWSISEGRLLIHLEKVQERWWNKLLDTEEPIDLDKIDCSRPLDELPEDHIVKIRELQWNQERKMQGLPTTDEMKQIEILKKAWNAEGSPFKGKKFDPSVLRK